MNKLKSVKKVILFIFLIFFLGYGLQSLTGSSSVFADENQKSSVVKNSKSQLNSSDSEHKPGFSGDTKGKLKPISMLWAIPFVLILLSIALFPLLAPDFWHHNYWKVSLFVFAFPMLLCTMVFYDSVGLNETLKTNTFHEIQSYISFILLIGSLFTIAGAIYIRGTLVGTPLLNTIILGIGGLLASFMATTGASMLLIRPLIRANKFRTKKVHTIIFFIFIVSNIGGLLTPLGDPPLFLGYLKGVPFTFTFKLVPEWLITNGILLALYFIWDTIVYNKEKKQGLIKEDPDNQVKESFKIEGLPQFILLGGVVFAIYFQGALSIKYGHSWPHFGPMEGAMALMWILSVVVSRPSSELRKKNEFSWFPIKEVSALFAGIFACMVPTLYLLNLYGGDLGVATPRQFFWATGILSSFLDNAPTYLVFLELGQVVKGLDVAGIVKEVNVLAAISCGAVFMGANSYIGNAPNFMVKAIAEEQGIKMPSFFGYMIYSMAILIPIFILITFIFFR